MKRKFMAVLFTGMLGVSLAVTGCENKEDNSAASGAETTAPATESGEDTQAAQTEEPTETTTPEPLKTIGTADTQGYQVQMKNSTGKVITGVSIKEMEAEEYPENMMGSDDSFAKDEERLLYYKPDSEEGTDAAADAQSEEADSEKLLTPGYDIQLSFKDGTTMELHAFPFEDVEECEIKLEDDVAFIVYDSVADNKEVSTKEAELAVAEQEKAEAAAAEESVESDSYEESYDYTEPVYEEPVYEEPVYQEPVYEEPVYQEPVYEEPAAPADGGGGDACLEGGLVF